MIDIYYCFGFSNYFLKENFEHLLSKEMFHYRGSRDFCYFTNFLSNFFIGVVYGGSGVGNNSIEKNGIFIQYFIFPRLLGLI